MDLSVIERFETPVKVLRLSDAIRRGAAGRGECYGAWWDGRGSVCATMAACIATGMPAEATPYGEAIRAHLSDKNIMPDYAIWNGILDRNEQRMPSAKIADWLEAQGY